MLLEINGRKQLLGSMYGVVLMILNRAQGRDLISIYHDIDIGWMDGWDR